MPEQSQTRTSGSAEVRAFDGDDARRDAAVALFKRHARIARPDTDYDTDIEYLEHAVIAFADEWGSRSRAGAEYALQVLVAMADDDELAALEITLEEEATTASRDALVAARRKVEADIAAYRGES